jgi:hypothetical protein
MLHVLVHWDGHVHIAKLNCNRGLRHGHATTACDRNSLRCVLQRGKEGLTLRGYVDSPHVHPPEVFVRCGTPSKHGVSARHVHLPPTVSTRLLEMCRPCLKDRSGRREGLVTARHLFCSALPDICAALRQGTGHWDRHTGCDPGELTCVSMQTNGMQTYM